MNLPLFDRTYTVSELGEELSALVGEAYRDIWVTGEVQRFRRSRRGHCYLELVEKGLEDDVVGKIDAVIWRSTAAKVLRELASTDQSLDDGMEVKVRGRVDFYPPNGRLQLIIDRVDPVFSLGMLERRRRETLAALAEAGLLDLNKGLVLTALPLRVALVTSQGSAAYHDFVSTLERSGFGFRLTVIHSAVQGAGAEREVVSALRTAASLEVEVVALVRGGGSRSDLALFDNRRVAETIARLPLPVITGLGHEIDRAVADRVAHTALATPTKVAEHLVRRVEAAEDRLEQAGAAIPHAARAILRRGRERVGRARGGIDAVRSRLRREGDRLAVIGSLLSRLAGQRLRREDELVGGVRRRLVQGARRPVERARRGRSRVGRAVATAAGARLRSWSDRCRGLERLCEDLAPERILGRGFSITRTAGGSVVRTSDDVAAGDRIVSELATGRIDSVVEER